MEFRRLIPYYFLEHQWGIISFGFFLGTSDNERVLRGCVGISSRLYRKSSTPAHSPRRDRPQTSVNNSGSKGDRASVINYTRWKKPRIAFQEFIQRYPTPIKNQVYLYTSILQPINFRSKFRTDLNFATI